MLGAHLRALRKAKGLTVTALAARIGRPQCTLSRWETDRNTPDHADLRTLLVALGASPEDRLKASDLAAGVVEHIAPPADDGDNTLQLPLLPVDHTPRLAIAS